MKKHNYRQSLRLLLCSLCSAQCAVHYTVYSIHSGCCTVHTVHCTSKVQCSTVMLSPALTWVKQLLLLDPINCLWCRQFCLLLCFSFFLLLLLFVGWSCPTNYSSSLTPTTYLDLLIGWSQNIYSLYFFLSLFACSCSMLTTYLLAGWPNISFFENSLKKFREFCFTKMSSHFILQAASIRVYYIGKYSCSAIFGQISIKFVPLFVFFFRLVGKLEQRVSRILKGLAEICIWTLINLIALLIFSSGGQR